MDFSDLTRQFISNRVIDKEISCKSFVVTFFGDLVSQHGGWIWMGSLIAALEPLGFSERLIRTSVFRLVQDDWLKVEKAGRKSFYAFTDSALRHYTKAARRIYANKTYSSDSRWLIVIPTAVPEPKQQSFRRQLRWLGFSPLASGAFAHPSIESESLNETLKELSLTDSVIVFSCETADQNSSQVLKNFVNKAWDLEALANGYKEFVEAYKPFREFIEFADKKTDMPLNDQEALHLRLLLIHEYRRILLKDHELPEAMLPANWPGYEACILVGKIYQYFSHFSLRYIENHFENSYGLMPQVSSSFSRRFSSTRN